MSTFAGQDIRPTSDRVREAVFSILYSRIGELQGKHILDLFAGTGALALEALSRGAASGIAVEQNSRAADLIESNARACRLAENLEIIRSKVSASMPVLQRRAPFDLIFLDPPYNRHMLEPALLQIDRFSLLAHNGIVCAESARKEVVPENLGALSLVDVRSYGSSSVHFFIHSDQGGNQE